MRNFEKLERCIPSDLQRSSKSKFDIILLFAQLDIVKFG